MHDSALDSYLKEVPKNTNKLEATLSIIKADFLGEKIFFEGAGEVEGFDTA